MVGQAPASKEYRHVEAPAYYTHNSPGSWLPPCPHAIASKYGLCVISPFFPLFTSSEESWIVQRDARN